VHPSAGRLAGDAAELPDPGGGDADPDDPLVQFDVDSVRRAASKILKAISP